MRSFNKIVESLSNKVFKRYERSLKAMEKINAGNYSYKLESLRSKLTDEYKLWMLKKSSHPNRFYDVERDVNTIKSLLPKVDDLNATEKATIDRLCYKYNVS